MLRFLTPGSIPAPPPPVSPDQTFPKKNAELSGCTLDTRLNFERSSIWGQSPNLSKTAKWRKR